MLNLCFDAVFAVLHPCRSVIMPARDLGLWAGPFPIAHPRAVKTAFASIQKDYCKSTPCRATATGHKWDPKLTAYDKVAPSRRAKENGEYGTDKGKVKGFCIKRKYCTCITCGVKFKFRLVRLALDGEETNSRGIGAFPLLWVCLQACNTALGSVS